MTDPTIDDRRRRSEWQQHLAYLGVAVVVVAFSLSLKVREDERVELKPLPQWALPETCLSRQWFGIECPGCGLTRSFIRLADGDWSDSIAKNRVGWMVALLVLGQIPYRLERLWKLRTANAPLITPRWTTYLSYSVVAALVGNWLLKQFGW